jgi:hypothetical protein
MIRSRTIFGLRVAIVAISLLLAHCAPDSEPEPERDPCEIQACTPWPIRAELSSLTVSAGVLSPEFPTSYDNYSVEVDGSFEVTVEVPDRENIEVSFEGQRVAPGVPFRIEMSGTLARIVELDVKSSTGSERTYELRAMRPPTTVVSENWEHYRRGKYVLSGDGQRLFVPYSGSLEHFSAGGVEVFERGVDSWQSLGWISAPDDELWEGLDVVADHTGELVIVSSPRTKLVDVESESLDGALFIMRESANQWSVMQRIDRGAPPEDQWGHAIALNKSGRVLAVATPVSSWHVRPIDIYTADSAGTWQLSAALSLTGDESRHTYYYAQALSVDDAGDTVVASNYSKLFVWEQRREVWFQARVEQPPGGVTGDFALSGDGARIFASVSGEGDSRGVAVYERHASGEWRIVAKVDRTWARFTSMATNEDGSKLLAVEDEYSVDGLYWLFTANHDGSAWPLTGALQRTNSLNLDAKDAYTYGPYFAATPDLGTTAIIAKPRDAAGSVMLIYRAD